MGDNLYGASAEISATLFLKNAPVYFTCGDIGVLGQALINKTLIVTEIEIGLCAVVGDEYFTVLNRVHGARVDVDVRIKLLHGYLVTAGFQKTTEGCGGNSFSQTGDNASGDKNVLNWHDCETSFFAVHVLPKSQNKVKSQKI